MSITRSLRYGAAELKRLYNRNLAFALVISVAVHLVLICLYLITTPAGAVDDPGRPVVDYRFKILNPPARPDQPKPPLVTPPVDPGIVGPDISRGGNEVSGDAIVVPDAMVDDSIKFATSDHLGSASTQPGDGPGFGGGSDSGGTGSRLAVTLSPASIEKEQEIPEEPDFVAYEEEPQFDMNELHDLVKYPELARKNRIEGRVTVQVFVDKMGRPAKVRIAQSSNKLFDGAALEAVQKTRFTPAIQNKTPIGVWVTIPIVFTLE
jgi:TonB family protein